MTVLAAISVADDTRIELIRVLDRGCPECGAHTQGAKFCPECGKSLRPKNECSKCGTKFESGTKFCPECGNKIS